MAYPEELLVETSAERSSFPAEKTTIGSLVSPKTAATPTRQSAPTLGNDITSAEATGIAGVAGAGLNLGTSYLAGKMQNEESAAAREESKQIAGMNRRDYLKEQKFDYSLNKTRLQREKDQFALDKDIKKFDLSINRLISKLKMASKARANLAENAKSYGAALKYSENQGQITDMIGGKV